MIPKAFLESLLATGEKPTTSLKFNWQEGPAGTFTEFGL
jgi:hypothetical protein